MDTIYSLKGRPFRRDADSLWAKDGHYVGKFYDEMVFSPTGEYVGELRNDLLGYRNNHANRHKGSHSRKSNKMAASTMTKMAKMMPMGWDEFHG